jgi:hypothetical protein
MAATSTVLREIPEAKASIFMIDPSISPWMASAKAEALTLQAFGSSGTVSPWTGKGAGPVIRRKSRHPTFPPLAPPAPRAMGAQAFAGLS